MKDANTSKRPRFFWQGLMMILPVLALAAFGLVSLRQDEQAAVRVAFERARQDAQSLTRAMRVAVGEEAKRFETLEADWADGLREASRPSSGVTFPDAKLAAAVSVWEQDHPGLKFAELTTPAARVLRNGSEIYPPEIPVTPVPPQWFTGLSAPQRDLWQKARMAGDNRVEAVKSFLASKPNGEACLAVNYLEQKPEQVLMEDRVLPMDSGISFRDLACFRVLNGDEAISPQLWEKIWGQVFETPSFMAPTILNLAEDKARDLRLHDKMRYMRGLWAAETSARTWTDHLHLQRRPDWTNNSSSGDAPWPQWSDGSAGSALAVFSKAAFTNSGPAESGYQIVFVPLPVVQAMFKQALEETRLFVPEYARVSIELQGRMLTDGPSPNETKMAEAGSWSKEGDASDWHFTTTYWLESRGKMLEAQKRHARLLSALIGAVVLTGVAGLLAARRAFYEQCRLSEMKSNFVSSVSHELRAPIASMRLLSEALERGKVSEPAKLREYYHFLVQESCRLTSLIENVLDFSRIEQGRKEYRMEPADLDALAGQTVTLMRPYASEHQVTLRWQPGGEPAPQISCDGPALQQALINLIDNAIKHSPAGAEVAVGLESGAGRARLWVEDRGPGIPAEEHEKIFERFYRRGSELRRETQGIGIGLTIVKHIVEAHGGAVRVRSAPGQGSRFTIELPLSPPLEK